MKYKTVNIKNIKVTFLRENDVLFVFTPLYSVKGFTFFICIYVRILVSNTISISYDVRVA